MRTEMVVNFNGTLKQGGSIGETTGIQPVLPKKVRREAITGSAGSIQRVEEDMPFHGTDGCIRQVH